MVILATIASLIFSIIMYGIGYYGSDKFIGVRLKKFEKVNRLKTIFKKHSKISILIARFIPFSRTYVSLLAGFCKENFFSYLFFSAFGFFVWNYILIFLGVTVIINFESFLAFYHTYKILILILISASILAIIVKKITNKTR